MSKAEELKVCKGGGQHSYWCRDCGHGPFYFDPVDDEKMNQDIWRGMEALREQKSKLEARIAELEGELDVAKIVAKERFDENERLKSRDFECPDCGSTQFHFIEADAEEKLAIAVEALEFYAGGDHYHSGEDDGYGNFAYYMKEDGEKAREALERIKPAELFRSPKYLDDPNNLCTVCGTPHGDKEICPQVAGE